MRSTFEPPWKEGRWVAVYRRGQPLWVALPSVVVLVSGGYDQGRHGGLSLRVKERTFPSSRGDGGPLPRLAYRKYEAPAPKPWVAMAPWERFVKRPPPSARTVCERPLRDSASRIETNSRGRSLRLRPPGLAMKAQIRFITDERGAQSGGRILERWRNEADE